MKKLIIGIMLSLICAFIVIAQNIGKAYSYIGETVGTTNYLGMTRTTENTAGTPSTNAAVWKIIRTIEDASGNIVSIKHAYGSGAGDNSLWTTAWTNRAAATYK